MTRARLFVILAAIAAGCSGGSEKPGAVLHGPGALAIFDGFVAHDTGSLRPYLAVANERGDELRLIDATDNEVVTSPGVVYPLSVPIAGRPILMVSADLGDGLLVDGVRNLHDRPDALVVIAAGSTEVELVDTWSGYPTVVSTIDLGAGVEVLSMAAAALPDGAGGMVSGKARLLVAIAGQALVVIELSRPGPGDEIVAAAPVVVSIGFDAVSLAPGKLPGVVYAASRDLLPPGFTTHGVARISLPPVLSGATVDPLDALAPTEAVAVASAASWTFPNPGSGVVSDLFADSTPLAERVVAVPVAAACGDGKPVRCGLLALDPTLAWGGATLGHLERKPATTPVLPDPEPYLLPIPLPAPVAGILATGRAAANLLPIVSGAGTVSTSSLAAIAATDGRIYLVDLARWSIASDTSPLVGTYKTRVSVASTVVGSSSSAIGLFGLDGAAATIAVAALPARIRVTPGFTPDDVWTLTWQGTLPDLDGRAAVLGRDGGGLWLAVQIGSLSPVSAASLDALGVEVGDTVEIGSISALCPAGVELTVNAILAGDATRPGGRVQLDDPSVTGPCRDSLLALASSVGASATFRGSALVLAGVASGHAGRPALDLVAPFDAPAEHLVDATHFPQRFPRLFYVSDACATGSECAAAWTVPPLSLAFPLPSGPALGLAPGLVDGDGNATNLLPLRGTSIHFTTASGLVPSVRRPVVKGTAVASSLPSGLTLLDGGASGAGVQVYASFTAGLVMSFSTAAAPGAVAVIR